MGPCEIHYSGHTFSGRHRHVMAFTQVDRLLDTISIKLKFFSTSLGLSSCGVGWAERNDQGCLFLSAWCILIIIELTTSSQFGLATLKLGRAQLSENSASKTKHPQMGWMIWLCRSCIKHWIPITQPTIISIMLFANKSEIFCSSMIYLGITIYLRHQQWLSGLYRVGSANKL